MWCFGLHYEVSGSFSYKMSVFVLQSRYAVVRGGNHLPIKNSNFSSAVPKHVAQYSPSPRYNRMLLLVDR